MFTFFQAFICGFLLAAAINQFAEGNLAPAAISLTLSVMNGVFYFVLQRDQQLNG